MRQFSNVSSKYGAPMGRGSTTNLPIGKIKCFRVNSVDFDYDDGGAYWGGIDSKPLYCFRGDGDNDEQFEVFERCTTREFALEYFANKYCGRVKTWSLHRG